MQIAKNEKYQKNFDENVAIFKWIISNESTLTFWTNCGSFFSNVEQKKYVSEAFREKPDGERLLWTDREPVWESWDEDRIGFWRNPAGGHRYQRQCK